MVHKADYSNTQKYSNRRSFDRQPLPTDKVLVPFCMDLYNLNKTDYIDTNCTTIHLGKFNYLIGFMAIDEHQYASYMKDFWADLNKDMEMRREGRCVTGKNPDGTDKLLTPDAVQDVRTRAFWNVTIRNVWRFFLSTMNMMGKPLTSQTPRSRP